MNLFILTLTVAMASSVAAEGPPIFVKLAATARYVVHNNDWGYLATISTHDPNKGNPFADVFSFSDGPVGNSTGMPYFLLSPIDASVLDMTVNPNVAFAVSEEHSGYCKTKKWDPEDPRCAKIVLSGTIVSVPEDEISFASEAVYSRHPGMADWINRTQHSYHSFYFAKMEVKDVWVLDFFGPGHTVSAEHYFKAKP